MKKAYIAGPMTGFDDFNYSEFHRAAEFLREQLKVEVVSPAEQGFESNNMPYGEIIFACLKLVNSADAVVLLSGWTRSAGAMAEFRRAAESGKDIYTLKWKTITNFGLQYPLLQKLDA